ncbi:MAG: helix-turn-helix transcriptional regulator [Fretibacterium sp.]|nr:helix-turn-helix transcriptional regulator [Fretibacterium sp.]
MPDGNELRERLRKFRKKAGLTQEELAERVGVHLNTISQWENGLFTPKTLKLKKLASALGVSEAELLNGPEEHKIKIELIFGKMPDEEVLDMSETGNKFKLFMDNDGALGIHGGAKFSCLDDIKKFIADAEEELVKGFNFQKDRGALPATA